MRHTIKMLGLVLGMALSACEGGGEQNAFGKFVGAWRATAGTVTTTCPGYASETQALTGTTTWSQGVGSDLVSTDGLVSCPLMADVSASTATGLPGQSCTEADATGATATIMLTGYTFVLSPDGRTGTENASGQITYTEQGAIVVCSFNESGSYQKISN